MKKPLLIPFTYVISLTRATKDEKELFIIAKESTYMGPKRKERLATLIFNKKESSYVSQKDSLDRLMNTFQNNQSRTNIYTGGPNRKQVVVVKCILSLVKTVFGAVLKNGLQYVAEKIYFKWNLQNESKKIENLHLIKQLQI
jgi:hypothetical protein